MGLTDEIPQHKWIHSHFDYIPPSMLHPLLSIGDCVFVDISQRHDAPVVLITRLMLSSFNETSTRIVFGNEISAELLLELIQVVGFTLMVRQDWNCFRKSNFLGS